MTENAAPFRLFRFGALIAARSELRHVRAWARSPGKKGVREQAFGSLKYERLDWEHIVDPFDLVREGDAFRAEFNQSRPRTSLFWCWPLDVHLGQSDSATLNSPEPKARPTPWHGTNL